MRLRPRFVLPMVALRYLPAALFLGAWLGGFGGMLITFATDGEPGAVFPAAIAAGMLLLWVLFVFGTARDYALTEYRIGDEGIEYEEGFLGREHKELPWSRVTECTLRQGVLQRAYGVGTIVLATPATGPTGSAAGSGMKIMDVPEPEWVHAEVRERVRRARESRAEAAHAARV